MRVGRVLQRVSCANRYFEFAAGGKIEDSFASPVFNPSEPSRGTRANPVSDWFLKITPSSSGTPNSKP